MWGAETLNYRLPLIVVQIIADEHVIIKMVEKINGGKHEYLFNISCAICEMLDKIKKKNNLLFMSFMVLFLLVTFTSLISGEYETRGTRLAVGLGLYALLVIISFCSYLCLTREVTAKWSWIYRINLLLSYLILIYCSDSTLYFEPTWAETVTNFMHNSLYSTSILDTLQMTDAGYLPLTQRIISICTFNLFQFSAYSGLFVMQIFSYIATGAIFSFFMRKEFSDVLPDKTRYAICLVIMGCMFELATGTLINFMTYACLIVYLYFLVDSKKWSRASFIELCVVGFFVCMSKGIYVTMLPFLVVSIIIFAKSFTKRDIIFSMSISLGAILQLVYYLNNGSNWVDASGSSNVDNYYLKLACSIFVDLPNNLLAIAGSKISWFNICALPVIVVIWGGLGYGFVQHVVIKRIRKQEVSRYTKTFYMMIIYIIGQGLFFRMTVYEVSAASVISRDFWSFTNRGINGRYQDMIFLAVLVSVIICLRCGKERLTSRKYSAVLITTMLVFLGVISVLRMGHTNVAERDVLSEVELMKGIETAECRLVPIQPDGWVYSKEANCYCFGANVFAWECTLVESEEPQLGKIDVGKMEFVDTQVPIYQIFVSKSDFTNNSEYVVNLFDEEGKRIASKSQDDNAEKRITSFTFEFAVRDCYSIQITDANGNQVNVENAMYIVTSQSDRSYIMQE